MPGLADERLDAVGDVDVVAPVRRLEREVVGVCFIAVRSCHAMAVTRCAWAEGSSEAMLAYHDEEWGVPSHDDRHLFELLTLEGAQAGLSWSTILDKREGYRRAFADFDADGGGALRAGRRRAPARGSRHRPQPAQGRVDGRERGARSSGARPGLRRVPLGTRRRQAARRRLAVARRPAGRDRPLARALARPEAARLPLRRADRLLLVHAGGRARRTTTRSTASASRELAG